MVSVFPAAITDPIGELGEILLSELNGIVKRNETQTRYLPGDFPARQGHPGMREYDTRIPSLFTVN